MRVRLSTAIAASLLLWPMARVFARAAATLVPEATIPLADVSGRIDHLTIDLARKRLFVAELGNNTVDVIDLATRKVIHRITGLSEPQGVGYAPSADVLVVACSGDGAVKFFGGADFAPRGVILLGDDADNVHVDPRSGHVLVGYGSGGLAIIDPAKRVKLTDIHLPEHPEGFQPFAHHIYVNVPDAHKIVDINFDADKVVAIWPMALSANFPMALDETGHTIAVIFRGSSTLALLHTDTGAIAFQSDTCGDADDVFFDAKRHRLYVSCGSGDVDVFQRDASGIHRLERVATSGGARTSLFVPELDRLFVAERAGLFGSNAAIQIFRPTP